MQQHIIAITIMITNDQTGNMLIPVVSICSPDCNLPPHWNLFVQAVCFCYSCGICHYSVNLRISKITECADAPYK